MLKVSKEVEGGVMNSKGLPWALCCCLGGLAFVLAA